MANVKICDGRSHLFRWDTGVKIELCDCYNVTECHFVTEDGVIRRDVVGNICDVPDVALTKAGTLVVYAFSRTDEEGSTRHEFRIPVPDRPKPADYIDPPDESDTIDLIAERVAGLIDPGSSGGGGITKETDPTVPDWAKQKEKPTYTAEEVGAQPKGDYALKSDIPEIPAIPAPYVLPVATADTLGGVRVGEGLQMTGDVMSAVPDGKYELIEEITFEEDAFVDKSKEPDGTPYSFRNIVVRVRKPAEIIFQEISAFTSFSDGTALNTYIQATAATTEQYQTIEIENRYGTWLFSRSQWGLLTAPVNIASNKSISMQKSVNGAVICRWNSTKPFPAGSTIWIYGVRS